MAPSALLSSQPPMLRAVAGSADPSVRTAAGIVMGWLPRYLPMPLDRRAEEQAHAHLAFVRATRGADAMFSDQLALNMILLARLAYAKRATPDTAYQTALDILHEIMRDYPD